MFTVLTSVQKMHIGCVFYLMPGAILSLQCQTSIRLSDMNCPCISVLGNLEEQTLSGTVHIMTPTTPAEMFQHPDVPEQNLVGTNMVVDVTRGEIEDNQVEETTDILTYGENDDPLSRFFCHPPVTTKCSAALQVIP